MEMLSGAEMVVRSLIDQGVKHLLATRAVPCWIFMTPCIRLEGLSIFWFGMSRGGTHG